jgi:hypothetical protein
LNNINPTMARSSSPAAALAARDSRSSSSARNSRDGGPPDRASCSASRRARFGLRPPAAPAGTQSPIAEVDQPGAGSRHHHGAHRNQDDTQPGNAEQGGDLRDVVPPPGRLEPGPGDHSARDQAERSRKVDKERDVLHGGSVTRPF